MKKVNQLQSLIGLLNFACRVISLGRAFCRRLINLSHTSFPPIRATLEMKTDLQVCLSFLQSYNVVSVIREGYAMQLFTDSAGVEIGDRDLLSRQVGLFAMASRLVLFGHYP